METVGGIIGVALKVFTSSVMDSDDVVLARNTLAHSASAEATTLSLETEQGVENYIAVKSL